MTKPVAGLITGRWADLRPRAAPTRPHGGIDIAADVGAPILAPEQGVMYHFCLRRQTKDQWWKWKLKEAAVNGLPWGAYGYDLYGGITVLQSMGGARVHLFCHSWLRQLWSNSVAWSYQESPDDEDFPVMLFSTFTHPIMVAEGERIAEVGNQGESTAPHCHWEVHNGWAWTPYADRPDPEKLLEV